MQSVSLKLDIISLAALDISPLEDGSYVINRINVPQKYRGQRHGSFLLKSICDQADHFRVDLALCINPYGALNYEQLHAWYTRYGFKPTAPNSGWLCRKPLVVS